MCHESYTDMPHKASSNTGTVAVIGLGYVGLPLALLAAKKGYNVIGIDVNLEKVRLLQNRTCPFADDRIEKELKEAKNIDFTTDFSSVSNSETVVMCVPTPIYENHTPNLTPIEGACTSIAPYLKVGHLVILESTVNPGVCESIVMPILEKFSGLRCGVDFYLAHCPERINPGDKKWTVENIPRILGSLEKSGLRKAADFYRSIITGEVREMNSLKEAEAVKVVENSFRDINIAFVNELAMSFSKLGIDVVNVIEGASSKPFAFMTHYPGCGVGGHCIPVDPYYLIEYAKMNGFNHDFLSLARRINNQMPKYAAYQALKGLNEKKISINGARVVVLGLAYKSDIDDCRESPSYEIIKTLKSYGADVAVYDPYVLKESTDPTLDDAMASAKAVVIATAHQEFKEKITPEYLYEKGVQVIVDGRNCLPKDKFIGAGIVYKGIGR